MLARSWVPVWSVVWAASCRGPDIAVATETGGGTSGSIGSTGSTTTDPMDPTDAEKFDLPSQDLPPPPPLDCEMRPEFPLEAECAADELTWPAPFLSWYALIYTCGPDDEKDVCSAPGAPEVRDLIEGCYPCRVEEFAGAVCGPDPSREDRCCYWALARIRGCPE